MRNFLNIRAFDSRRTIPVASLRFEKDFAFNTIYLLRHKGSKTTRILSIGIYYHIPQGFKSTLSPNRMQTYFLKNEPGKIINLLHDFS
jgi:hypothetical protein